MLTRFYHTSSLDLQHIPKALETQYTADGFHVQSLGDANKMIVQVKKEGIIRFLMGFDKAIGVTVEHIEDGFLVQIGAQDWVDKAVVAFNPHTASGALLGAIDQNKVVHHVMDSIDRLIHEQHADVAWSDAPKGV